MRRFLSHAVCVVAGLVAGAAFGFLWPTSSATSSNVQVAAGEEWAAAWDVANGTELQNFGRVNLPPQATFTDPATGFYVHRPVTSHVYHGKQLVGMVLADGRCIVLRFKEPGLPGAVILAWPR